MAASLCVITVSYNSAAVLPSFLTSIPPGVPVIVADNASDDKSAELAEDAGARVVRLERNLGYGGACNAAAAEASAEWLVFANPDIVFESGALDALLASGRAYPEAAFNPRIYEGNRRRFRTWSRLLQEDEFWNGPPPEEDVAVPVLSGACILVRKAHFDAIDGFDPEIFLFHEDDDLSLRLKKSGVDLRLCADAVVRHAAGHSSARSPRTGHIKGVAMGQSLVHVMAKHGRLCDFAAERRRARMKLALPHVLFNRARRAKHLGFIEGLRETVPAAPVDAQYVPLTDRNPPPSSDVRLIAYYLPQFHPIPENDAAWGAGFTEWTNVRRAFPVFPGHDQPRMPGDLGYYDLRDPDVMRRQMELAKLYGVGGFAFHFYWFGGKTLLELPVQNYLSDASLDLPFMLCWANENWSRRWSGSEKDIIVAQKYSPDDDLAFLRHAEHYFRDPRYIRVYGKPVLTIYRPSEFPDIAATIRRWRTEMERLGYPGIYLIATNAFDYHNHARDGFDALSEFPPHALRAPDISKRLKLSPVREGGRIRDYAETVVHAMRAAPPEGEVHPGVMPGWDNSARRLVSGNIYRGASPSVFRDWLVHAIARARKNPEGRRLVFINAWNEWAEGAYLEPDAKRGYAFLQACADALRTPADVASHSSGSSMSAALRAFWRHPFKSDKRRRYRDLRTSHARAAQRRAQAAQPVRKEPAEGASNANIRPIGASPQVALVVHAFYPDLMPEILEYTAAMPSRHRLFVSTIAGHEREVRALLQASGRDHILGIHDNRGRDILPFLRILEMIDPKEFPLIAKVHTKKSSHRRDGDFLRGHILGRLLSPEMFEGNIAAFVSDSTLGLLGPESQFVSMRDHLGANGEAVMDLAVRLGFTPGQALGGGFFAGSMFIARTDALLPLARMAFTAEQFEPELGQVDGTLAHAIERAVGLSVRSAGFKFMRV